MLNISIEGKKRMMIFVVALALGLMLGYYAGAYFTIKAVVEIGSGFIDKEIIEDAIYQYKNHIKARYPNEMDDNYWDNLPDNN